MYVTIKSVKRASKNCTSACVSAVLFKIRDMRSTSLLTDSIIPKMCVMSSIDKGMSSGKRSK